jgi:hypothetical protein
VYDSIRLFGEEIARVNEHCLVGRAVQYSVRDDGFTSRQPFRFINHLVDGKMARAEVFEAGELAQALERIDELIAG